MQTSILRNRVPLNDYRLIIDTPLVVHKKIANIKTSFDSDYKGLVIAGGNPFIYLASFSQYENAEYKMVDALNRIAMGFMPFKIHLKNFDHIENSEIYIKLNEEETVNYLIKQIKAVSSDMKEIRLNELPRISIAQRLQPWQFEKSWPDFAHKNLTATFLADQMLLLKRMEGFRSWQVLKHMAFQNQYITA
ncbi:MAG: hypothetical protein ACK5NK_08145 [Niabella sp.]